MNTNIASLYEFTLQQMAAESYFEQNKLSGFVAQMKFLAEKYRNSEKYCVTP